MVQETITELVQRITNDLPDNTSELVSAADVRNVVMNMVNSGLFRGTGTIAQNRLPMVGADGQTLTDSSISELDAEIDFDKPVLFRPSINIGASEVRVLGEFLYLATGVSNRQFTISGAAFTEAGTTNPVYIKLDASEELPEASQQRLFNEELALTAGDTMSYMETGSAGTGHILRQIQINVASAGTVRLEVFAGTDASGRKLVDQTEALSSGLQTLTFETYPVVQPGINFFVRYTAVSDVTLRGSTISAVFRPFSVFSGWPVNEVRVLTEDDFAYIATQLNALAGDERLSYSSLKDLPASITGADITGLLEALTGANRLDYNALKNRPNIPASFSEPSFSSFVVGTQGQTVDAPFTISGATSVTYSIDNVSNVQGTLEILQETNILAQNITPASSGSTSVLAINTTLQAGESVTFTINGTSSLSGNPVFSRTYTITARQSQDNVFVLDDDNNTASTFNTANATATPFAAGNQVVTIPTFTGNRYLKIAQRASDPEITQILIGGVNQFAAFTKTDDAVTIDGAAFDVYVSNNLLVGSVVSGTQMTLVRATS